MRVVVLLIAMGFSPLVLGSHCHASSPDAVPTNGHSLVVDEIVRILAPDKHITKSAVSGKNGKGRDLLSDQIEAIKNAGELKATNVVTSLIYYLDYVEDSTLLISATPRASTGSKRLENARKIWPAYDTLLKIGRGSLPQLARFVEDESGDTTLRLAVLQVVRDIDIRAAVALGDRLLKRYAGNEQAQDLEVRIREVIEGKLRFWGVR